MLKNTDKPFTALHLNKKLDEIYFEGRKHPKK